MRLPRLLWFVSHRLTDASSLYADLDTDCLLPVEQNILSPHNVPTIAHREASEMSEASLPDRADMNRTAFVGRMGTDENFAHSIPNAWMVSPPGHPFFHLMLEWARDSIADQTDDNHGTPEAVTGPIALRNGVLEYVKSEYHPSPTAETLDGAADPDLVRHGRRTEPNPEGRAQTLGNVTLSWPHDITILPFHHIYPYSWERDGQFVRDICWSLSDSFNETRCKELLAVDRWQSTAITYWSHSWDDKGHNTGNLDKVSV